MYFSLLTSLATLTLANQTHNHIPPTFPSHAQHRPRRGAPGGVYTCALPHWKQCDPWITPTQAVRCHELAPESVINSLGPDLGGYCLLHWGWGCNTSTVFRTVRFPGVEERLERFSSWKCFIG